MKIVWLLLLVFCLSSCSLMESGTRPELAALSSVDTKEVICGNAFVRGDWQFVHSITFSIANGYGATVVGVTVMEEGKLKTALMGVEGFVLFEAEQGEGDGIAVLRAVAPFDKPGFAEGLMTDVRTLLMAPQESELFLGSTGDGDLICRYSTKDGSVTDVMKGRQGWCRIDVWDKENSKMRTIIGTDHSMIDGQSIPGRIELTALDGPGYTLQLELLSAEKI